MRIVGGSLRGRRLLAPIDRSLRPTAERTRESLFDLLTQGRALSGRDAVAGATVMDAFAGTGALGLEALSRGAESAVFLEKSHAACSLIRRNLVNFGIAQKGRVQQGDALHPPPSRQAVDLCLMDPPYGADLEEPALLALARAGWLGPETLIALERAAKDRVILPPGAELLDERRYGRARILLFRMGVANEEPTREE